jgi:hypothetical protein
LAGGELEGAAALAAAADFNAVRAGRRLRCHPVVAVATEVHEVPSAIEEVGVGFEHPEGRILRVGI